MKKVGILTFHRSENYGSVLQAYALCRKINSYKGFQAELIDFSNARQKELYAVFLPWNSAKNILKNIRACTILPNLTARKKNFSQFIEALPKSKRQICTDADFKSIATDYDIVVCGSDQIWNPQSLDFSIHFFAPLMQAKKIAYAPSLRNARPADFNGIDIKKPVEDFARLSVREAESVSVFQQLTGRTPQVVLDPTLLLQAEDYTDLIKKAPQGDYLFYYSIDYNEQACRAVKQVAKRLGLPVKILFTGNKTYGALKYGFQLCKNNAPGDFLALVKHAKLVLSTSFHGTAFAVIFRRPFYALKAMRGDALYTDARLQTFLKAIKLEERYIPCSRAEEIDCTAIQADEALLNQEIRKSETYLKEALNC